MLELRQTIQNAATTGNGTVASLGRGADGTKWTFHVAGSAGVSAGAVQIETAPSAAYAGTWEAIGSPITVVASTALSLSFDGAMRHCRARISTNIVGGTVTVTAEVMS